MGVRNLILSMIQKKGGNNSAMNSAFDNANEVAAKMQKK